MLSFATLRRECMDRLIFVLMSPRLLLFLFAPLPALAQVVPDATLPVNSKVTSQGNFITITGGSRAGTNLFHSFQQFSVPSGGTAYFNNDLNVKNIIGRITGTSASNIDGLLRANGAANLFLINPNGIFLGRNASLNIGGSFIGTTASSLKFADGTQFSAAAPQDTALLTISVPLGLQFGPRPGEIRSQGPGAVRDPETALLLNRKAGLRVQPNQTLALVGGNLSLEGSVITTDGGRIELGSVTGSSFVNLTPIGKGWSLGYEGVQNFQDIKLSHEAAVDASGRGGGDIQVQGGHVMITDGSQVEASTVGSQAGGTLAVTGSQTIEINGISPNGFSSGIFSDVYSTATGAGDTLKVKAGQLNINDSGVIETSTLGRGQGGDLIVNVPGSIEVGLNSYSNTYTGLTAFTAGAGNAGKLTIVAGDLILTNGGQVNTGALNQGRGGDLFIQALNSVKLIGSPQKNITGLFSEAERGSTGGGGNITVKTGNLVVTNGAAVGASSAGLGQSGNITLTTGDLLAIDGGQLQAATGGPGQGGNLTVDAFGLVDLRGTTSSGFPSGLFTTTQGSGNAGNLKISAANFKASGGAVASASTSGRGNAGNIFLAATDSIALSGFGPTGLSSGLFARSTGLGQAGSINSDSAIFSVANAAVVSSVTSNLGHGGSITIKANTLKAENGGQVLASTSAGGNAGDIRLNVLNSIAIVGSDANYADRLSLLGADRISTQGAASGIFANTASVSTGKGGSIFIDPTNFTLADGASVAVNSLGKGDAGELDVKAGTVTLNGGSSLLATTANSEGGNLNLQANNLFLLRGGSQISATAGTAKAGGDGGNITIKTPFIVAVPSENSDISANAYTGKGGNINITAQGIFGIQPRNQDTPLSDITASSQFGINGTVQINILNPTTVQEVQVLPTSTVDPTKLIAPACAANVGPHANSFIITGSGGLPPNPSAPQHPDRAWADLGSNPPSTKVSSAQFSNKSTPAIVPSTEIEYYGGPLVEAQAMVRGKDGDVILTADAPTLTPDIPWLKPPSCQPH